MLEMLAEYSLTSVPCNFPENDPMADPKYHDGYWGPWIKPTVSKEVVKHPTSYKSMTYSFLSIVFLVLYCLYYRYMRRNHLCKTQPVKYKI